MFPAKIDNRMIDAEVRRGDMLFLLPVGICKGNSDGQGVRLGGCVLRDCAHRLVRERPKGTAQHTLHAWKVSTAEYPITSMIIQST